MNDDKGSLDILGVKPIADSINTVTKGTVDGASAFLSRICLPAADEFGLLLKDKVSSWRANNAVEIANKASDLINDDEEVHAHPKIAWATIEHGSWAEDEILQNMWAGLLATGCTEDGKDESNLILINLLSQLTSNQVKLIEYLAIKSEVFITQAGWIGAFPYYMELDELIEVMEISDFHRIDRELDHLRSLELITNGFSQDSTEANVTPTALCLHLYTRGKGYVSSPSEYFEAPVKSKKELDSEFNKRFKD